MITVEERKEIISKFKTSENDSGSSPVQIAILTARILALTKHLQKHRKDYSTQSGLLKMVGTRNRLLRYLRNTNRELYENTIKELGLRK